MTYCWKALDCELCKFKFPDIIKSRTGKTIKIMSYERPEKDFLVLESVTSQNIKIVHSIDMSSHYDEIKIGRGHDCQIRITDISVSRMHAFIKKANSGEYVVEDNGSKFGTLVMVRKPMILDKKSNNFFQAGRTILELAINEQDEGCCSLCFGIGTSKKAAKGSLSQDEEGDFYPEEFL
jgi:hypothetical protein